MMPPSAPPPGSPPGSPGSSDPPDAPGPALIAAVTLTSVGAMASAVLLVRHRVAMEPTHARLMEYDR
jgi:hypothetical protein